MSFWVAITTHNRFDTFLKERILKYLSNKRIIGVIILDDCSEDYQKINDCADFTDEMKERIIVYRNKENLGCYRNKIKLMSILPEDKWYAFMDSDNYGGEEYFGCLDGRELKTDVVYCPGWPSPSPALDFRGRTYTEVNKGNWEKHFDVNDPFYNTMNYVIHGSLCNKLASLVETYTDEPTCLDSIYINHRLVRDCDATLRLEREMIYHHAVHGGSNFVAFQKNFAKDAALDWSM